MSLGIPFIDNTIDNIAAYVVGGDGTMTLGILAIAAVVVLMLFMLAADFPIEFVLVIISPVLLKLGMDGILPGVSTGVGTLILGGIWTLIILGIVSGR